MNQMPIFFCILHARRHGRSIVMVGHKRIYDGDEQMIFMHDAV
jgi:hypothetical protein